MHRFFTRMTGSASGRKVLLCCSHGPGISKKDTIIVYYYDGALFVNSVIIDKYLTY